MFIPEPISMYKGMRGNEWFKPRSHVPLLSQGWVNSTQRHELRVGKERVISQREQGMIIKMRGIDAGQQKQQMPTKRLERKITVFVLELKIAAAAVGGQRNCLGTLWAGACELLIPHGHSCGFNYLYPSSTFHLRRCSVNLAKWNQKEQRKGWEGGRRCQLRKVLRVSELWYRQVCCVFPTIPDFVPCSWALRTASPGSPCSLASGWHWLTVGIIRRWKGRRRDSDIYSSWLLPALSWFWQYLHPTMPSTSVGWFLFHGATFIYSILEAWCTKSIHGCGP